MLSIGCKFTHCDTEMTVIAHGKSNGYNAYIKGLLCHYRNNEGEIRELFFSPYKSTYVELISKERPND